MDKIFISGLTLNTLIGIYAEERTNSQPIKLDLELFVDTHKSAVSDDITDTVDYDFLAIELKKWVSTTQFYLLEALAAYIAKRIMEQFTKIEYLRLRITKLNAVPSAECVGVEIERHR
jgi:dihydroneopterin aldolase